MYIGQNRMLTFVCNALWMPGPQTGAILVACLDDVRFAQKSVGDSVRLNIN